MDLGGRVKQLRVSKQLTQKALADLLGISYQNIGHLESGNIRKHPRYIADLAKVLGVTVDYLIRGETANYQDQEVIHDLIATDRPINTNTGDKLYVVSCPSTVELILPSHATIQAKVVSRFIKS